MAHVPELIVQNRQRKIPLNLPELTVFARRALPAVLAFPSPSHDGLAALANLAEISIALISDRVMARLHWKFMNIAGATDVLTFQHGEILISVETAARLAPDYHHTTQQEIALYILHGLLHLRGFDDTTPAAHTEMHRVQGELFARLTAK